MKCHKTVRTVKRKNQLKRLLREAGLTNNLINRWRCATNTNCQPALKEGQCRSLRGPTREKPPTQPSQLHPFSQETISLPLWRRGPPPRTTPCPLNSGYVRSFLRRASSKTFSPLSATPLLANPSRCIGDTMVVSTANCSTSTVDS